MKTLNLTQGTPEWHATRLQHFTASEAPAMLGLSKYMKRDELLRQKKTGLVPEVDAGTQRLFDRGHAVEALARPIVEAMIGDELYPATGVETVEGLPLLASFDGITMDELTLFEHKLLNQKLADIITANDDLPDTHWPQVEHQLLVSGAERCLFVVSDGTEQNLVSIWYASKPERRQRVIAGWKQFAADLAEYVPEAVQPEPVKAAVESLPAVFVEVRGSLTCLDNIGAFAAKLGEFLERVPAKPATDEDFAVCEAAVKTLEKAETALKAAKESSLGYVQSLADLHCLIDTQAEIARSNRLRLDKLVKAEKENRKVAIVNQAQMDFRTFVAGLRHCDYLPALNPDFAGAIKGLKTISSITRAANDCLANAKIEATRWHGQVAANLEAIESVGDYIFLFRDLRDLALKDADYVALTVKSRITEHKEAEAKRLEAERERIRAEEQAKAEREAAQRQQVELAAQTVTPTEKPEPQQPTLRIVEPAAEAGERITLGQINTRLAPIQLSAEGLRQLGFEPVGKERAAILYRAADFPRICAVLIDKIRSAADLRQSA